MRTSPARPRPLGGWGTPWLCGLNGGLISGPAVSEHVPFLLPLLRKASLAMLAVSADELLLGILGTEAGSLRYGSPIRLSWRLVVLFSFH